MSVNSRLFSHFWRVSFSGYLLDTYSKPATKLQVITWRPRCATPLGLGLGLTLAQALALTLTLTLGETYFAPN